MELTELLERLEGVRSSDTGWSALCPAHDDQRQSLSVAQADGKLLVRCHAGCSVQSVVAALELQMRDLFIDRGSTRKFEIAATYDYRDADGALLYQVVRMRPKDFRFRRPDGGGGWVWNLKGVRRILYRLPQVLATPQDSSVYIVEGEKDVDRLHDLGLVATCSPGGAGKWRDRYRPSLKGRQVVVIPDNDDQGRDHAQAVAQSVYSVAGSIRIVTLPGVPEKGDASTWLDSGHTVNELERLAEQAPEWAPVTVRTKDPNVKICSLSQVEEIFARWLYMPEFGTLEIVLATIVANCLPGDPVWLLTIGTPGSGKTELLIATSCLPYIHPTATLTEASLLSGTPTKTRAKGAKGGLLREIGNFGILMIKDFGSILTLNRDSRGSILQALRECFDGSWTRHVGTEGGRTLHWEGKLGIVGGATPAIDAHHSVLSILGQRFLFYRLPPTKEHDLAAGALDHLGREPQMRRELRNAVGGLFAGLTVPDTLPPLTEDEREWLIALARLTARCRSGVIRDGYRREIIQVVGVEAPTRLVLSFARLLAALKILLVEIGAAYQLIYKVGLDSMPQLRRMIVQTLLGKDWEKTPNIAAAVNHPTTTTRRSLEELNCYGILDRQPGHTDRWRLTDLARELWRGAKSFPKCGG